VRKAALTKMLENAYANLGTVRDVIQEVRDEVEEFIEDHSEKWQESEKGEEWRGLMDELDEHLDTLDVAQPEMPE